MNYYSEWDKKTAAWLRELIRAELIPPGDVDERSIRDVHPTELAGYTQCHFFAGIGGWSYALQLAGWPATEPVWTGSCPCQPFSAAGKQAGQADDRHLWPDFARLIRECRPAIVLGEQVASAIGFGWLDEVCADLEGQGYAVGAAVLGAHSVGAPHIRQRLYWVADAMQTGRTERRTITRSGQASRCGGNGWVDDATHSNRRTIIEHEPGAHAQARGRGNTLRLGDADRAGLQGRCEQPGECTDQRSAWSASKPVACADGKQRRIPLEPAFFTLANGLPARVVRLRGYGNAIVPQTAAEFIKAAVGLAG